MTTVRRALRMGIGVWMAAQLVGAAAAPLVLCSASQPAASDSHAACCPGVGPGQVCPMHKTREGAARCTMSSACHASDAALLSLFTSIGVTPQSDFTLDAGASTGGVVARVEGSIARASFPEPHPPRL